MSISPMQGTLPHRMGHKDNVQDIPPTPVLSQGTSETFFSF